MRKNILGLAAITLLLAACSQDENQNPTDNVLTPIEIGTKSPEIKAELSRAAITDNWAGTQNVGIYGLSKTATDWLTGEDACILENVNASIATETGNKLVLGQTYYYPIGSTQPYTFYGYYPYQYDIAVTANSLEVPVTITGQEDLLWGIAEATTPSPTENYDGFNSRYMRDGGATPDMQFEHLLTRFTFSATDATVPQSSTGTLKINSIKIVNAKNSATLLVATNDEESKALEGTLIDAEGDAELILKDSQGQEINPIVLPKGTAAEIGESIMVIPNELSYNLVVEIELDGDPDTRIERNMEIKRQGVNEGEVFEAGASHKIHLTVYGPTEIEITTILTDWVNKEDIPLVIE